MEGYSPRTSLRHSTSDAISSSSASECLLSTKPPVPFTHPSQQLRVPNDGFDHAGVQATEGEAKSLAQNLRIHRPNNEPGVAAMPAIMFADEIFASQHVAFHLNTDFRLSSSSTPSLSHSCASTTSSARSSTDSSDAGSFTLTESTNATASDLPGPGRILGNLYSRGGRPLERALGRFAHRVGLFPRSVDPGVDARGAAEESEGSRSINYTMSDLPGPERILGNLYSSGGRRLEKGVARLAKKWPSDLDYQISSIIVYSRGNISDGDRKSVKKMCKKMLNYTHSSMIPTQIEALTGIVDLCVWSPVVREAFQQSDAEITLSTVARRRDAGSDDGNEESTRRLFLFSRRALLASQDNQVHDLGKVLIPQLGDNWRGVQWCKVDDKKWGVETVHAVSGAGAASTEWKVAFMRMLSYLRDPELAFLALRYFDLWSFFVHESAVQYDIGLTLQLCACLLTLLSSDSLYNIVETKPLEYTTRRVHDKLTALSFLHQLPGAEPAHEIIKFGGCDVHIPNVIRMLNSMREGLNTRNLSMYYTRPNLKLLPEIALSKYEDMVDFN